MSFRTIEWRDNKVVMIDQTRLPGEEVYNEYEDFQSVAEAIRGMIIRGAPAIGVAAAMGVALGAREIIADTYESFSRQLSNVCDVLARTRPTAVNLFWAIERMKRVAEQPGQGPSLYPGNSQGRGDPHRGRRPGDLPRHRPSWRAADPGRSHRSHPLQRRRAGYSRIWYRPGGDSCRP